LYEETPWIPINNKYHTCWFTQHGCKCNYSYANKQSKSFSPAPFTPLLERLAEQLAIVTGHLQGFNSCNANLYENNFASLGLHADDEELFGYHYDEKFIVSFSLGAAREFLIRIKSEGHDISHKIQHGEILTMERLFQTECLHGVPVAPSVDSPRINLTFRNVVNHEPYCPIARS
jgi:alkylated DNA repair dioxygenase AlkB